LWDAVFHPHLRKLFKRVVAREGIELPTLAFQDRPNKRFE
jgi:hypothetical protein